ncbi:hypothetical protein [Streptomyces canus]|uniref:hypothetical protein n=1 Tax=Streptomyces canus TaxID=58343 RepID=UPI0032554DD7
MAVEAKVGGTYASGRISAKNIASYAPHLRLPDAGNQYDRYEEFGGYIDAEGRDGIPWPRATVRIDVPGQTPYMVTDANVDISYATRAMQYLSLMIHGLRAVPYRRSQSNETTKVKIRWAPSTTKL